MRFTVAARRRGRVAAEPLPFFAADFLAIKVAIPHRPFDDPESLQIVPQQTDGIKRRATNSTGLAKFFKVAGTLRVPSANCDWAYDGRHTECAYYYLSQADELAGPARTPQVT